MASAEFAELFSNAVPGFFSLSNHFFELKNPVASTMMSWRDTCDSTIRIAAQILSRGQPPLSQQLNEASQQVVLGNMTPQAAAQQLQSGLDSWYAPQQEAAKSREVSGCAVPSAVSAATGTSGASATDASIQAAEAAVLQESPATP